jgi:hypothetical protein
MPANGVIERFAQLGHFVTTTDKRSRERSTT